MKRCRAFSAELASRLQTTQILGLEVEPRPWRRLLLLGHGGQVVHLSQGLWWELSAGPVRSPLSGYHKRPPKSTFVAEVKARAARLLRCQAIGTRTSNCAGAREEQCHLHPTSSVNGNHRKLYEFNMKLYTCRAIIQSDGIFSFVATGLCWPMLSRFQWPGSVLKL